MTAVAIIPARGGSKRIPRKNIRAFDGLPLIAYSIRAAQVSGLFQRIVVSTDDDEIAHVARQHGAETPFVRPAALSDNHAGTMEVIQHALAELDEDCTYACCIYATAPMLQARFLRQGLELLRARPEKSYAFSVTTFGFPIQRALRTTPDGSVDAIYPEYRLARSQDLEPAWHDAGQFYWGRCEAWRRADTLFSDVALPVLLPSYLVQDIDTPEDWRRAELMYASLKAADELGS